MSRSWSPSPPFAGYEICSWHSIIRSPVAPRPCLGTLSFLNYLRRILVVSEPNKFGMSEMIRSGPFQKLNLCDHLRSHPNTFLYLLRSEALTPAAGGRFGKVDERTFWSSQTFEPLEDFTACCRHESGPHACGTDEVFAAVEASESTPRLLGM
jgi:hypothetical protein